MISIQSPFPYVNSISKHVVMWQCSAMLIQWFSSSITTMMRKTETCQWPQQCVSGFTVSYCLVSFEDKHLISWDLGNLLIEICRLIKFRLIIITSQDHLKKWHHCDRQIKIRSIFTPLTKWTIYIPSIPDIEHGWKNVYLWIWYCAAWLWFIK